jgi:hypothetical protein
MSAASNDHCFNEHPNQLLQQLATTVVEEQSADECKCRCAYRLAAQSRILPPTPLCSSSQIYNHTCLSTQYNYQTRTCILNRDSHVTRPDRFETGPDTRVIQSYFYFTCASTNCRHFGDFNFINFKFKLCSIFNFFKNLSNFSQRASHVQVVSVWQIQICKSRRTQLA